MQEQPFDRAVTAKELYRHTDAGKQRPRQTVIRGPSSYRLATCPIGDRGPLPHGHGSVSTPKQQRAGILTLPISKDFRDTLYSGSFEVSFSKWASASWGGN